jgi:hypothetical protein
MNFIPSESHFARSRSAALRKSAKSFTLKSVAQTRLSGSEAFRVNTSNRSATSTGSELGLTQLNVAFAG